MAQTAICVLGLGWGGSVNPLPTRGTGAGPHGAVPCPRLPQERRRCPCPKRHGWAGLVFWITFPLVVFWPGHSRAAAGSEERQDRRGAAGVGLDPAVPGSSSGPTGFLGQMLWHCPTGVTPAVPPTTVSHAGCAEQLGLPLLPAEVPSRCVWLSERCGLPSVCACRV